MFANLKKRDQNALLAAGMATVLFLLMQFVVFPVLESAPKQGNGIEEKELSLKRAQRLVAASTGESANLAVVEEKLKGLEGGLLESPSVNLANAEWQRMIRELADSKGLSLGSSEFLRVFELSPEYTLVTGRTQLTCRLDQLVDFMIAMGSAPKPLAVTHLRLVPMLGDPQKRMSVEMTVGAVMRAEKRPSPSTPKAR
jgi:hypothetical protein